MFVPKIYRLLAFFLLLKVACAAPAAFSVTASTISSSPPASEGNALCNIWSSTKGSSWDYTKVMDIDGQITTKGARWLCDKGAPTTSVCSWVGVTCSDNNANVIGLVLGQMNVAGVLPSLSGLPQLASLGIFYNPMTDVSSVDDSILKKLVYLRLSYLSLTKQIPLASIVKRNKDTLLVLDASYPCGFSTSSNCNSKLAGTVSSIVSPADVPNLFSLALGGNDLSGHLPEFFLDGCPFQRFDLVNNPKLQGSPLANLAKCTKMMILALGGCSFSGTFVDTVKSSDGKKSFSLASLTSMFFLDVSSNEFQGTIPSSVGKWTGMKSLQLDDNAFHGSLAGVLDNMRNLTWLTINNNRPLSDVKTTSCPKGFTAGLPTVISKAMPRLTTLNVGQNCFSQAVPSDLGKLSLASISFADNLFTGGIPNLSMSKSLTFINFANNPTMTGSIPSTLASLSLLKWLDLSNCAFSGDLPPNLLVNMPNLNYVNFSSSGGLTGSIPLKQLLGTKSCQLNAIDFSGNKFSTFDKLDGVATSCPFLDQIILRGNAIGGATVGDVVNGNFPSLQLLDVGINKFTGLGSKQPPSSLATLNVDQNQISGGIDKLMSSFRSSSLVNLALGGNLLTGDVGAVRWSTNFPNLNSLGLQQNPLLTGCFPKIGIQALNLTGDLTVQYNELYASSTLVNIENLSMCGKTTLCAPFSAQADFSMTGVLTIQGWPVVFDASSATSLSAILALYLGKGKLTCNNIAISVPKSSQQNMRSLSATVTAPFTIKSALIPQKTASNMFTLFSDALNDAKGMNAFFLSIGSAFGGTKLAASSLASGFTPSTVPLPPSSKVPAPVSAPVVSPPSSASPTDASGINSGASASGGGGGSSTTPVVGGAVGGILILAAVFAYWWFYMRKTAPHLAHQETDSIPSISTKLQRQTTMDNPMMAPPGSRDSIPLFVPVAGLQNQQQVRGSTWDSPSQEGWTGAGQPGRLDPSYDASGNTPQLPNQQRLSTAVAGSVNTGALYTARASAQFQHAVHPGTGNPMHGATQYDDL